MNILSSKVSLSVALAAGFLAPCITGQAHIIGDAPHDEMTRRIEREFRPVRVALLAPAAKVRADGGAIDVEPASAAIFARFAPAVRGKAGSLAKRPGMVLAADGVPASKKTISTVRGASWVQRLASVL